MHQVLQGLQGLQGVDGVSAGNTFEYFFSTNTTSGDPGAGYVRFNNSTIENSTEIYLDHIGADNFDLSDFYTLVNQYGSPGNKGFIKVQSVGNPTNIYVFTITEFVEQVSGASGWSILDVTNAVIAGSGFSNNEEIYISFGLAGLQGVQGNQGLQRIS